MKRFQKDKGQSTLEYLLLVSVVIAVIIAASSRLNSAVTTSSGASFDEMMDTAGSLNMKQ